MAVFDVPAPPEVVWDCINDIKQYPKMVSGVTAVQIYDGPKSIGGGGTLTKAQYTLSFVGYKVSYYVELKYEPRLNSMTFHLDYSRNSDLDDTVGHWHVVAIDGPDGAVHSRISYSAALTLCGYQSRGRHALRDDPRPSDAVAPEAKKRLAAGGAGGSVVVAAKKTARRLPWSSRDKAIVETLAPPPPPSARADGHHRQLIALVAAGGAASVCWALDQLSWRFRSSRGVCLAFGTPLWSRGSRLPNSMSKCVPASSADRCAVPDVLE